MIRTQPLQRIRRQTNGFTLLELLLVVFIMSILAFSAVSLTESLDSSQDQFRYERARHQASKLEQAIVVQTTGERSVRGFVADMGDLPDHMTELAFGVVDGDPNDTVFMASQNVTPVFDPTPDASFYSNASGDEIILSTSLNVIKGFRGMALQTDEAIPRPFYMGAYLPLTPGTTLYEGANKPRFDDGWGTLAPAGSFTKRNSYTPVASNGLGNDELTHGWNWTFPGGSEATLHISSYGKNGILGGTDYDEDLILATINADDWSVDSAAVHVELFNDAFEVERDCSDLRPFLLVFNAKIQRWRVIPGPLFGSISNGGVSRIAFATGLRIPAGNHILLLASNLNSVTTPLALSNEVQAGVTGSTQPEIQRLFVAADSRHIKYKLQVTLPDPNDPVNLSVTYTNDLYDLSSISTRITELNSKFVAGGGGAGQYDTGPLEYVADDNTIKLDPAAATSAMTNNHDLAPIQIIFDPADVNNVLLRAKHVDILPGQTNVLRMNLSALTP